MHVFLQREQILLASDGRGGAGRGGATGCYSGHVMWAAALSCPSSGRELEPESKHNLQTVRWVWYFTSYRVHLHRRCIHDKKHVYDCWSAVMSWRKMGEPRNSRWRNSQQLPGREQSGSGRRPPGRWRGPSGGTEGSQPCHRKTHVLW